MVDTIDFPYQSRFISLPSLGPVNNSVHYIDEGQGEVVLCLHGNPTWSYYYRRVIERLRRNYRVIAYDHFGCGLSSRAEDFPATLADHMRICGEMIARLKLGRVHLVVHDWGGPIGLGWASAHPDQVRSVTVLNSAVFMEEKVPARIAFLTLPVVGEFLIRRFNLFARAAVYMATAKGLSAEQRRGMLFPYSNWTQRLGIARFVRDIPKNPRHPSYSLLKKIAADLKQLRCPTLILWGMKDFCFHPGFIPGWQRIFTHAELRTFPDAGHYLLEDEQEAVPAAIEEFLGRVSPR